jgi:hypothetical protein
MAGIGRFVAVGDSTGDASNIGYSDDGGETWTVAAPADQNGLFRGVQGRGIAYGNGRFVAVGESTGDASNIGYSNDGGETWTVAATNTNGLFRGYGGYGIAYGNGTFVAVGKAVNDISNIGYSTDGGETWTVAANPDGASRRYARGIASDGSGTFVVVGKVSNDASNIGYSTDGGRTWRVAQNTNGLLYGRESGFGVAYGLNQDGSGVFVAVGDSSNDLSNIGYSLDGGVTWTVSANPDGLFTSTDQNLYFYVRGYAIATDGNGTFVAVGKSQDDFSNIGYSTNGGETWRVSTNTNGLLNNTSVNFFDYGGGIAYGNGRFVVVGNSQDDVSNIGYSDDGGVNWTVVARTDQNGLFSGNRGFGIAFAPPPPPPNPIYNICFPAGTPIKTDQGIFPIEKLHANKHTINQYTIQHITKTITQDTHLICFEQHALGLNVPSEKTVMTKEHKILFEGRYVAAEKFLSLSKKVTKIKYNGELLYNVLLENYGTLQVNNLVCETLHPDNLIAKLYNNYKEAERPELVYQLNASLLERNAKKYKAVERKILHK